MSTARAVVVVESISKRRLRELPAPKTNPAARLERIKELAGYLLNEAESLDHENALAEVSATVDGLEMESGVDFFEEVKRFETQLIGRALELTGGNQARAARILGLGTTTLNYKIKQYQLA